MEIDAMISQKVTLIQAYIFGFSDFFGTIGGLAL